MRRFLKNAVMVAALGALVGASITVAAPGDRQDSDSDSKGTRTFERRVDGPGHRGGPFGRAFLATAANKLDVSQAKLRAALRKVHQDLGPPEPPANDSSDPREQMEKRCTQVTDGVGKELGKSGDDVRAAFKSAALEGLDKAVDRGRISKDRASQIRSRLESRSCILPRPIGIRCGPGPGPGGGPPGGGRGSVEPGAVPAPPPGGGEQGAAAF